MDIGGCQSRARNLAHHISASQVAVDRRISVVDNRNRLVRRASISSRVHRTEIDVLLRHIERQVGINFDRRRISSDVIGAIINLHISSPIIRTPRIVSAVISRFSEIFQVSRASEGGDSVARTGTIAFHAVGRIDLIAIIIVSRADISLRRAIDDRRCRD